VGRQKLQKGAPITKYMWVRLDEGLLSRVHVGKIGWGAPIRVPADQIGWGLLSQYLWVAWMGTPITVPVG